MWITITVAVVCLIVLCVLFLLRAIRTKNKADLAQYAITAEALHSLLASNEEVLLFDIRQPLDLLAYPEIIPGARRIPPEEILATPTLIAKEKHAVVYCTCPSDKTSRLVLRQYVSLNFSRIKFLKGGLAAWKAQGYSVEPYRESFHLHRASTAAASK